MIKCLNLTPVQIEYLKQAAKPGKFPYDSFRQSVSTAKALGRMGLLETGRRVTPLGLKVLEVIKEAEKS